jgi:RNA polymerase primary sigma factor
MLPEDAEQIGFFGLIEAARRFRPERGCQFSTYATPWIRQVCQRYGPPFALMIRMPDHAFWASFRLRLTLEELVGKIGASGVHDFVTQLDLHDPRAGRLLRDLGRVTEIKSLSDKKGPEYRKARQIPEPFTDPIDELKDAEIARKVQAAISKLRTRDAKIIRLRYGFDGTPAQTLEAIGALFSITRERVRQIQAKAERRLRGYLEDEVDYRPLAVKAKVNESYESIQGLRTGELVSL